MHEIHQSVSQYYTDKLNQHGETHAGVDWNSTESQIWRFRQLMWLHNVDSSLPFSILDYGCGYGAMIDYLVAENYDFSYTGYDIALAMVEAAQKKYAAQGIFTNDQSKLNPADYVVASGIFNVRLKTSDSEWLAYILQTLEIMWGYAQKGIAFNCLTSYSDKEYMRDYLYYANPAFIFDHCKRHFSKQVALLHDYGLYEFTLIVRREGS